MLSKYFHPLQSSFPFSLVEERADGSNKYYVTSQANYETAVQSLIFPQGFADYEGKHRKWVTSSDTNCAVQPQKMVGGLKFQI